MPTIKATKQKRTYREPYNTPVAAGRSRPNESSYAMKVEPLVKKRVVIGASKRPKQTKSRSGKF